MPPQQPGVPALPATPPAAGYPPEPAQLPAADASRDCVPQPSQQRAKPRNQPGLAGPAPGPPPDTTPGSAFPHAAPCSQRDGSPRFDASGGGLGARRPPLHDRRQAASSVRPLRRRAARMARPARVRMRSRKPCVLARCRLFGWKVRLLTSNSTIALPRDSSTPRARHTGTIGKASRCSRYLLGKGTRQRLLSSSLTLRRRGGQGQTGDRTGCPAPHRHRTLILDQLSILPHQLSKSDEPTHQNPPRPVPLDGGAESIQSGDDQA